MKKIITATNIAAAHAAVWDRIIKEAEAEEASAERADAEALKRSAS